MVCHSRAVNYVLGLTEKQMNRLHDYGNVKMNQLEMLADIGLFKEPLSKPANELSRLSDPFDLSADLNTRATSYLDANCSNCHVDAGGGNSQFSTEIEAKPDQMRLFDARPTAVNLGWALSRMRAHLAPLEPAQRAAAAYAEAARICDEDAAMNLAIGSAGLPLIREIAARKPGAPVNIMTHCNAGWLATVDWGTATAPIYLAHDEGIPLHIWVSETRPRNQGALTAFELAGHGVPHSYIVDNAAGLLIQQGQVDMVIVGTDRVTANGDVCNKIGTYLKALAANAHGVPFLVALPSSTFDAATANGGSVPIEQRAADEVSHVTGASDSGEPNKFAVTRSAARNPAFDITPAALVTTYLTDRGAATGAAELARMMADT